MTDQEKNPKDKAVTTPKPRSIAAANGGTTTPPTLQKDASEEELLRAKKPDCD